MDASSDGGGFLQVTAERVKGTRGQKRARLGLSVVAFRKGFSDEPWADAWLSARKKLGLDAKVRGALLPAVGAGNKFVNGVPMTSSQLNHFARDLLVAIFGAEAPEIVFSSHACKATLLSWAAKAGMSVADRRLLGGHAKPGDKSVLEYSRDALAGPLNKLEKLIGMVGKGQFMPDETRSGRWAKGCGPWMLSAAPQPRRAPASPSDVAVPSSSSEGASSSASSSASGDDNEAMLAFDQVDTQKYEDNGLSMVHNSRTLTAHLARKDHTLPCGRLLAPHFRQGAASFMPMCTQCENYANSSLSDKQ